MKRLFALGIVVILAFSLIGCQDQFPKSNYESAYRYESNSSASSRKKFEKNINFVGMSIWWYDGNELANGFGGGEEAKGYQTLLQESFDFRSTRNYCFNGFSLGANASGDASSIIESKADHLKGTKGDIWTLDTITNDFKRNIPIGTIEDYNNASGATTYYGALRAFVDCVEKESGEEAIVVCCNALPRKNSGYTSTSKNEKGHSLADYEYALMKIAAMRGWYFVDQFRFGGITDQNLSLTTLDGLHLNNFGYSMAIKPWIEQFDILYNKLLAE